MLCVIFFYSLANQGIHLVFVGIRCEEGGTAPNGEIISQLNMNDDLVRKLVFQVVLGLLKKDLRVTKALRELDLACIYGLHVMLLSNLTPEYFTLFFQSTI